MKKPKIIVWFLFIMLFLTACTQSASQPVPEKAALTDELTDVLRQPDDPSDTLPDEQNVKYHIVVDSRIASNNGRSGYLHRGCSTLQQVFACLKTSVSGKDYEGLHTGYQNVYETNPATNQRELKYVSRYMATDDFFTRAAAAGCPSCDILPSEAIEQMATEADEDDIYLFVTDFAMPRSGENYKIIDALDKIISNYDLTLGLIGIQADYSGTVYDIPISNFGVELPDDESYTKPVYLLFLGGKETVFDWMDRFLLTSESNSHLNEEGQINALYYYKYDFKPAETSSFDSLYEVAISYPENLSIYMRHCDSEIVFEPFADDPDKAALVDGVFLKRIYSGIQNTGSANVGTEQLGFTFHIPFQIVCDTQEPQSELMEASRRIELDNVSLALAGDIARAELRWTGEDQPLQIGIDGTVDDEELLIDFDSACIDVADGVVNVEGDYNVSSLKLDSPVIYAVRMHLECEVAPETLSEAYDVSWLEDWQMDLDEIQKYWGSDSVVELALDTPHIADIFGNALYSANIAAVKRYIAAEDGSFVQAVNFGFVLREQARYYDNETDWTDAEDFGWAFSSDDIDRIIENNNK